MPNTRLFVLLEKRGLRVGMPTMPLKSARRALRSNVSIVAVLSKCDAFAPLLLMRVVLLFIAELFRVTVTMLGDYLLCSLFLLLIVLMDPKILFLGLVRCNTSEGELFVSGKSSVTAL